MARQSTQTKKTTKQTRTRTPSSASFSGPNFNSSSATDDDEGASEEEEDAEKDKEQEEEKKDDSNDKDSEDETNANDKAAADLLSKQNRRDAKETDSVCVVVCCRVCRGAGCALMMRNVAKKKRERNQGCNN